MYPVSNAFHEAVANGNPQKAMLIFSDGMVFTNEDINVSDGIEFHDNFNMEESLSIGQATSNEISFSLFNDARLLNNYTFGDFLATCGVRIGTGTYSGSETARVQIGNDLFTAHATSPYVRKNGTGLSTQPAMKIVSMLAVDGKLYCYGGSSNYGIGYNASTGAVLSGGVQAHMAWKAAKFWSGSGRAYVSNTKTYREWKNGVVETYEFCPWGWFTAERPKAPDVILIDFTCHDYMQKFESDMDENIVTYPSTVSNLYASLCQRAGVQYVSGTFINSTAEIEKAPDEFANATMRDVLKWIAEAAGANARFNRDGRLEMSWVRTTGRTYHATDYGEFNPAWFVTQSVGKLYNRNTAMGTDETVGDGSEGYLIQDNPILRGEVE